MKHCSNRFGVILAAAAIALIAGAHGLRAQDQTGMFADADGIEPPDMGVAYSHPPQNTKTPPDEVTSPQLAALLLDADGIEPPDCGFAFDLDKANRDYVENQRSKRVAARSDGNR